MSDGENATIAPSRRVQRVALSVVIGGMTWPDLQLGRERPEADVKDKAPGRCWGPDFCSAFIGGTSPPHSIQ
jgi:hypothetical protein